jgi:hypothetical protein
VEENTRLIWNKFITYPEIRNSNIPLDQKIFLQKQLNDKFNGNFDLLLEDIEKYAVLSDVEDYENAAYIRDYRKNLK